MRVVGIGTGVRVVVGVGTSSQLPESMVRRWRGSMRVREAGGGGAAKLTARRLDMWREWKVDDWRGVVAGGEDKGERNT